MRGWLGAAVVLAVVAACGDAEPSRRDRLVEALRDADGAGLRGRPGLVAGKYARMRDDLYSFYRGTMPLWLRDASDGATPVGESRFAVAPMPLSLGDSHPENFGTLVASDGTLALEGNDFDAADRYPYHWDLRRLTVGMVLAARLSNPDHPKDRAKAAADAEAVVEATARGYAEAMVALAGGAPPERLEHPAADAALDALFDAAGDALEERDELDELTRAEDGVRTLLRGLPDPEDPTHSLVDLPVAAREALGATLTAWRSTLEVPPTWPVVVKDAVRELGTGVASWPRVRALVLLEGPTAALDDDVVLEIKELGESGAAPPLPAGPWAGDPRARISATTRALWARPDADALWGVSTWMGWPVQVRAESASHRNVRVRRLTGKAGTPKAIAALGRDLGRLVARMHAAPGPDGVSAAGAIAAAIGGDVEGFVAEQVAVSLVLADRVEEDWGLFREAMAEDGPLLGFHPSPADGPSPELAALLAAPPVPPWP